MLSHPEGRDSQKVIDNTGIGAQWASLGMSWGAPVASFCAYMESGKS